MWRGALLIAGLGAVAPGLDGAKSAVAASGYSIASPAPPDDISESENELSKADPDTHRLTAARSALTGYLNYVPDPSKWLICGTDQLERLMLYVPRVLHGQQ